jgi:large subunit ribosomal protein L22
MAVPMKTNERPGTRSQVRYARLSARKARAVLDLIRGKDVAEASRILGFSQRRAAKVIDKCLLAAVANAGHNDDIPPEELYVSACYADEGPTLKRYRPRARGRAGRIHKQTCHITVIVSRYSDDELDEMRRQAELRSDGAGPRSADARTERRRRVARSRAAQAETGDRSQAAKAPADADEADEASEQPIEDTIDEQPEKPTEAEAEADAEPAVAETAAAEEPEDDVADEPAETPEETD